MENKDFKRILKNKLLRHFHIKNERMVAGKTFDFTGDYSERTGRYFAFKELTFDSFGSNEVIMCREYGEIGEREIEEMKGYLRENYRSIAPQREDHMCTTLTLILIGNIEDGMRKRIERFTFYRSYLLGLKGWVDTKLICVDPQGEEVVSNKLGRREHAFIRGILSS